MASIADDANEILRKLADGTAKAMPILAEEMRIQLMNHIVKDVYVSSRQVVYPRQNTLLNGALNATAVVSPTSAALIYVPNGAVGGTFGQFYPKEHYERYGKEADDPIKPNPVSGDAFISRIESGNYDYVNARVGPRPFFSDAVKDLFEGGILLSMYISSVNGAYPDLQMIDLGDGELQRDGDDWSFG